MSIECTGYFKFCIEVNGDFYVDTAPPELMLHVSRYAYRIIGPYCAVAYDPNSAQPRNEYWARVKPPKLPHINGPIVFFRHWATFDYSDLARVRELRPCRFSSLNTETDVKWQRPSLPSPMQ